jgi:hypothetical protein
LAIAGAERFTLGFRPNAIGRDYRPILYSGSTAFSVTRVLLENCEKPRIIDRRKPAKNSRAVNESRENVRDHVRIAKTMGVG